MRVQRSGHITHHCSALRYGCSVALTALRCPSPCPCRLSDLTRLPALPASTPGSPLTYCSSSFPAFGILGKVQGLSFSHLTFVLSRPPALPMFMRSMSLDPQDDVSSVRMRGRREPNPATWGRGAPHESDVKVPMLALLSLKTPLCLFPLSYQFNIRSIVPFNSLFIGPALRYCGSPVSQTRLSCPTATVGCGRGGVPSGPWMRIFALRLWANGSDDLEQGKKNEKRKRKKKEQKKKAPSTLPGRQA